MPNTASPAAPRRLAAHWAAGRLWRYLAGFAAATFVAVLFATENYLVMKGSPREQGWLPLLLHELPAWYVWLCSVPLIVMLARRLPVQGPHRWRNLLLHLPLAAVVEFVNHAVILLLHYRGIPAEAKAHYGLVGLQMVGFASTFAYIYPIYFVILAAAHAADAYGESQRRSLREAQLQTLLERAQRDLLRTQLQPHFLFNTLHAISALMDRDVHAARRMIARLSDLLRLALDNDARHEVSLEEEVRFLERYAEIQRIRFGGRLAVHYDLEPGTARLMVPRLMLQPLVENSITHGLSRLERPGEVRVEARRRQGRLLLRVLDDGAGLARGGLAREGVGLGNTRARLEQLYGSEQLLEVSNRPGGGCEVRIELPASSEERLPVPAFAAS